MVRGRYLSLAAAMVLALVALGALLAPAETSAQSPCRATCWEAYGACYKSTSNRPRCQAQLQRCLDRCIRSKP